jgi:hypothetical protein
MPTDDKSTPRPSPPEPRSELIVTTKRGADVAPLFEKVRSLRGATLRPLFGEREKLARQADALREHGVEAPDLTRFYEIVAREEDYDRIIAEVRALGIVDSIYRKAAADAPYLPSGVTTYSCDETACCLCCWAPTETPDFSARQRYLEAGPGGIGARHAWGLGAEGQGVEIVDVERAWLFDHEDIGIVGGPLGGTPADCLRERNHGTAVLGMLVGNRNARGIIGICPRAHVRGYSTRTAGEPVSQIPGPAATSRAIIATTEALTNQYTEFGSGHIILLELQRIHPTTGFNIPVEWWIDDFVAIQHATAWGLIVVEAAGNGHPRRGLGADLDDAIYDTPLPNPDPAWTNPFRRNPAVPANPRHPDPADCGSILVGAGEPPIGTPRQDRSRLRYSNYGRCVDVQAWGKEVVTTGYGCMQGGPDEHRWYMGTFGGTSAASAMVAGVLACVQGFRRATGAQRLTSTGARDLLRQKGWPQLADGTQYPVGQRIGPRPDLETLIP